MRAVSLVGAAITLLGLLVLSAASGLRRGSGLSRVLVTIWFALLFSLNVLVLVASDRWDVGTAVAAVVSGAVVALLWTPPASRTFGRVRDSSLLTPAP